ncbi:MAG: circadian clock KaiB family protein [Crocosphaera sp.]
MTKIFTLYVTDNVKSRIVLENLRRIFSENNKDEYRLEIINILKEPLRAEEEKIIATPTLIRKIPLPIIRFIGDFSNVKDILVDL